MPNMPNMPNSIDEATKIILSKKDLLESKKKTVLKKKIKADMIKFKATKTKSELLTKEYINRRKQALSEEKLDFNGEEKVSIKGRQAFFNILKIAYDLDEFIPNPDVEIIKNAFYTHPDFIDKEKIRFVIEVANKNGGLDKADEVTSDMLSLLYGTKYYNPLQDFKKWIKRQKVSTRIKQLKQEGLSSLQISERLNITTAEVAVYSETTKEMPTLFGDNER